MKKKKSSAVVRCISVIAFILIWQVFCMYNQTAEVINPVFLPAPSEILQTMISYFKQGLLFKNVFASLGRIGKGYILGVSLAVIVGYFMAKQQLLNDILDPIFGIISSIPPYAFCPLFIIWFGIGESSKVILITYTTFMPMISYTVQGVRSVDPLLIRSAKSLGANELQVFSNVVVPSALPFILNGMKVCLGLTFAALIVAEMMGASSGLGYIIVNARNWFLVSDMFLSMALIALIYTIIKQILCLIEARVTRWKKSGMDAIE
ncbi:MAG: ABC transporter permease [Clostridia bacterium]|nr:ABC transporter permease [Lachnospiraceae bacterium]NCC00408.1 ABC transporter permease [Clostridia bacterium]NCD02607.1 ABC transporter permease [Clostridia bacterium]